MECRKRTLQHFWGSTKMVSVLFRVGRMESTIPPCAQIALETLKTEIPFKHNKDEASLKSIDLFAGIGGIRLAFQNMGISCVFSSEWDKYSRKTYAANFGEWPEGDITEIPASSVPEHDILLAGFPCQAFSQAGLRKGLVTPAALCSLTFREY